MRCHVSFSNVALIPFTSHTSPFQVQTAAPCPSLKKSNPLRRIHERPGIWYSVGTAISSTANAPSSFPNFPRVSMGGECGDDPFVRELKSTAGWEVTANP